MPHILRYAQRPCLLALDGAHRYARREHPVLDEGLVHHGRYPQGQGLHGSAGQDHHEGDDYPHKYVVLGYLCVDWWSTVQYVIPMYRIMAIVGGC